MGVKTKIQIQKFAYRFKSSEQSRCSVFFNVST